LAACAASVQALGYLAKALGLGRERRQVALKLDVALQEIGILAQQLLMLFVGHDRYDQPRRRKAPGSTITLAMLSAITRKSKGMETGGGPRHAGNDRPLR
jgi:signal transduction histidine kinase